MSIAVTGAEGQLGHELCRQLGGEALALDLPAFDLTRPDAMRDLLLNARPKAVINAAAYTRVDKAEEEPGACRAINVDGAAKLAEICRELDCPLVQLSTDYVFGRDPLRRRPYTEADEPGPQGVYAQSKRDAEQLVARWEKHFAVRTCGLYGRAAPRSAGNFVATMLRLARQGKPLRVVHDQYCTPTYVPHLARAIRFLLGTTAFGLYHVVSAGATTWYDLAAELFRQAGLAVELEPITTAQFGARAPRPAYSVLDTAKYHSLPNCPAMPAWQEGLAEYLAAVS